ncbi:TRAP-type mannitol/chloroaromatic compound transport system permease small subunit [Aliiruegeria haliotis]|uniref:TRAP transporter small permease protein n=1 Tax=Aliiruegeria haliotis TaxID=1280846 RepID=A0A2T0RY46_9RHOB|nr:TRAP transporter small permease [Aliiruegeria haliotis]PRY26105.1 TRAP-type mannitol/chloroaromatic compound transport system permease small subunit [Aliiruegeria haliotis]
MKNGTSKTVITGLSKLANGIAISANAVGTIVVLLLVLVVNYDVVARGIFNKPFLGAVEVVQFSMVLIVFLQLPDVVRVDRLTRSDGFLTVLGDRYPRTHNFIRRVINTVSAIFMTLIAIAIWPEFVEMLETRDYYGIPGVFTAPWWPIKLTIFLSAALCAIIFILKVVLKADNFELVRVPEHEEEDPS